MLELPVAAARQLASQLNRQEASDHERAIYDDKGVRDQLNNKNQNSKSSAAASPSAVAAVVAAAKAADAEKAAPDEATAVVADATTAAAAEATTADSALAGTAAEATESAAAPMDTPAEATMGVVAVVRGEQDSAAAAATSPSVQGLIGIDREMTEAGAKETIIKEVASTLLPSPSVASAVHLAAGNSGDSSASSSSSSSSTTTATSNKKRATASVSTSSSNNRTTSSAPSQKLQSNNKEVRQRSAVADGVATVCVFKISAADEPNRAYFGFTAAQAFHAMFKRVCEARREALLKLVQAHTTHLAPAAPSAPNAKAPADDAATATASDGENANMALGVKGAEKGSKTATSSTAQKDARAWLVPRVFGRRSAFASFGLTPAQWFGFGVALVQRRLETLPCVADLAALPKLPPPSFIANARAAAAAAAAASAAAATTSTSASARSPAQDIEIAEVAAATAAAAAWPPRYRCRFVKPTSDAVLSAVRALAARDARVKPNPSGCARAESRSNVASATARSKRVTRELHSGGNGGEGDGDSTSGGASGAAAGGARRGARAKTTGSGDSEDNRGSRSGLHVRNDSTSDEVRACACFNELAIVDISE